MSMKKLSVVFLLAGICTAFLLTGSAFAHSLWIEKDKDGNLSVCFGEFAEGLREKSGGTLDKIAHLEAWAVDQSGKKDKLHITKSDERLVLGIKNGNVVVQEAGLAPRKSRDEKAVFSKSFLYARFLDDSAGLKPELKLDILPVEDGSSVRVFFDGKPLAKQELTVTYDNGWSKKLETNEQGIALIDRPWPGLYVIDVSHTAEQPGNFEGQEYSRERHHTALSLEKQ
jgi:hypothetical protein